MEEQQNLVSIQRAEMNDVENELDKEHAEELLELRKGISQDARTDLENLKDNLLFKLKNEGMLVTSIMCI